MGAKYWTYELCREEAKRFTRITDWKNGHHKSYLAAYRKGWHRDIGDELGWTYHRAAKNLPLEVLNYEFCVEIAKEFRGLTDMKDSHRVVYEHCLKQGWLHQIAQDLDWYYQKRHDRSYEECKAIAGRYSRLAEWKAGDAACYQQCVSRKWQRQIAKELGWKIKGQP